MKRRDTGCHGQAVRYHGARASPVSTLCLPCSGGTCHRDLRGRPVSTECRGFRRRHAVGWSSHRTVTTKAMRVLAPDAVEAVLVGAQRVVDPPAKEDVLMVRRAFGQAHRKAGDQVQTDGFPDWAMVPTAHQWTGPAGSTPRRRSEDIRRGPRSTVLAGNPRRVPMPPYRNAIAQAAAC